MKRMPWVYKLLANYVKLSGGWHLLYEYSEIKTHELISKLNSLVVD